MGYVHPYYEGRTCSRKYDFDAPHPGLAALYGRSTFTRFIVPGWIHLFLGFLLFIMGIVDIAYTVDQYGNNCDQSSTCKANHAYSYAASPMYGGVLIFLTGVLTFYLTPYRIRHNIWLLKTYTGMSLVIVLVIGPLIIALNMMEILLNRDTFWRINSGAVELIDDTKFVLPLLLVLIAFVDWVIAITAVAIVICCLPRELNMYGSLKDLFPFPYCPTYPYNSRPLTPRQSCDQDLCAHPCDIPYHVRDASDYPVHRPSFTRDRCVKDDIREHYVKDVCMGPCRDVCLGSCRDTEVYHKFPVCREDSKKIVYKPLPVKSCPDICHPKPTSVVIHNRTCDPETKEVILDKKFDETSIIINNNVYKHRDGPICKNGCAYPCGNKCNKRKRLRRFDDCVFPGIEESTEDEYIHCQPKLQCKEKVQCEPVLHYNPHNPREPIEAKLHCKSKIHCKEKLSCKCEKLKRCSCNSIVDVEPEPCYNPVFEPCDTCQPPTVIQDVSSPPKCHKTPVIVRKLRHVYKPKAKPWTDPEPIIITELPDDDSTIDSRPIIIQKKKAKPKPFLIREDVISQPKTLKKEECFERPRPAPKIYIKEEVPVREVRSSGGDYPGFTPCNGPEISSTVSESSAVVPYKPAVRERIIHEERVRPGDYYYDHYTTREPRYRLPRWEFTTRPDYRSDRGPTPCERARMEKNSRWPQDPDAKVQRDGPSGYGNTKPVKNHPGKAVYDAKKDAAPAAAKEKAPAKMESRAEVPSDDDMYSIYNEFGGCGGQACKAYFSRDD